MQEMLKCCKSAEGHKRESKALKFLKMVREDLMKKEGRSCMLKERQGLDKVKTNAGEKHGTLLFHTPRAVVATMS